MTDVAIVAASRTPIAKAGRAYRDVHAADLLAASFRHCVDTAGVEPAHVEQVLAGCTHQAGEQALNVARNAWLAAGLPWTAAGTTLDTQCGSGQQAVNLASALIAAGQAEVVLAGGVESLSRVPMDSPAKLGGGLPYPPSQLKLWDMPHQGVAGERMAAKYGIDRRQCDEYALRSHLAAHAAWEDGRFDGEVAHVHGPDGVLLSRDEGIRADSTPQGLAALKPVYRPDGVITAGNASQVSDGSAAVLLASRRACDRLGLRPLAWIRRGLAVGVDPGIMMEGPIRATTMLLRREGLRLADIDLFEIHEAYAVPVCAWRTVHPVELERINVDGGAVGIGHPFGASGARQLGHLVHALRARGGGIGLHAMCAGGGIGTGTIIDVPA
ncbi:thiolase family protein [Spongiactinospora sp. 9N601]|uniref:thiolase family protein n=1 Tax=Spongiactinospora sp. 9N601 TaxID=3375149 RepID=UPI0037A45187